MNDDVKEYEIQSFMQRLIPWGSSDIRAAVEAACDAGHDGDWAADQVEEYIEETGSQLDKIDPVAVVYESLLQEAQSDIEQATNIDILNETRDQVYVAGDYMCTSLDYSTEAKEELEEILALIKEEDETDAITWLCNELDIDLAELRKAKQEEESEVTE